MNPLDDPTFGLDDFSTIGDFHFKKRKTPLDKMKKLILYWYQRRTRGFDDDQLYDLDVEIAGFILPRLQRLVEINQEGWFLNWATEEEFDMMMEGFELLACGRITSEDQRAIDTWRTFAEVVRGMWF